MSKYRVVQADLDRDERDIVALWERNLLAHKHLHHSRFRWFYRDNPYGPGQCWLLLHNDQLVGTAGLGLRRLKMGDDARLVGILCDFAVDKEHRSLLPALMLQKALLESPRDNINAFYGMPNENALGIFNRLGYKTVGTFSRHVMVLRVRPYLERMRHVPRVIGAPIGVFADGNVRTAARLRRPRTTSMVREISEANSAFDDLWRRSCGDSIRGERTAEFIDWRYLRCPLADYRILGLFKDGVSDLHGYAACRVDANGQAFVADFLTEERDNNAEQLLVHVVDWACKKGAASIVIDTMNATGLQGLLKRLRFKPRSLVRPVIRFGNDGASATQAESSAAVWVMMGGDEVAT